jgi:hypothetical protein
MCRFDVRGRKKKSHTSNSEFMRQTLALQTRSVQLQRQKLKLTARKVAALETIAGQLSLIQTMVALVHGVSVESYAEFAEQ